MIGGSLMQGKTGLREKIGGIAARFAGAAAAPVGRLGPVLANLGGRLGDGQRDTERDPRKQTVNRITEVLNAKYSGPDAMFHALQPMMGFPGDVAVKLHQQVMRGIQYLAAMIPKDPGIHIMPSGSKWVPSHQDAVEFAHRYEAVMKPMQAIQRAVAGQGHPAATEALWTVWPALMTELATEAAHVASQNPRMTYEKGSVLSALYRTPMTGLQTPQVAVTLQGLFLPKPTPPAQGGSGGSSPGRPAAVNSRVAGSSVSALTQ